MANTPGSAKSMMPNGKPMRRLVAAPSTTPVKTSVLDGPLKRVPIPKGRNKGK